MQGVEKDIIGGTYHGTVDGEALEAADHLIKNHPIEKIGKTLRASMTAMKPA